MDNNQREELLAMLQGTIDENSDYDEGEGLVGGKRKKAKKAPESAWIKHVKKYAKKHKKTYTQALKLAGPSFKRLKKTRGGVLSTDSVQTMDPSTIKNYNNLITDLGKKVHGEYKKISLYLGNGIGGSMSGYSDWEDTIGKATLDKMTDKQKKRSYAVAVLNNPGKWGNEPNSKFYRELGVVIMKAIQEKVSEFEGKDAIIAEKLDNINILRKELGLKELNLDEYEKIKDKK